MIDETRLSEVEEGTREQLAQQCRIAFSVAYVCWFQLPRGRQNQTSNIFSIQLLGSFFRIENMINSSTSLRPRCPPPLPASPQGRGIHPATPSRRPARDRSVSPAVVSAPPRSNLARALAPSARSAGLGFGS